MRRRRTSPTRVRLLVAGAERRLGEQVGQAVDDRLGQLAALGGDAQDVVGGVAVAAGERAVGVLGHALDARQLVGRRPRGRAGSRACGTARPALSRSTIRSTASLAIRRQVVSLPPVIVIIPLEVS